MNSEVNSNNKKLGRDAMMNGERLGLIPTGQCGSRKQHRAIDLALSKRLNWDLLLLNRRAAGWISNDAKSCFYRMVHWVATACLLIRFGIDWGPITLLFSTLQQSVHRVRTGFGDSERTFRPPSAVPFQGCGQGNGAGPTIWVTISAVLISMMISAGFGLELLSSLSLTLVVADCMSFVDDTDLVQAARSSETTGEDLISSIQAAVTLWTGGVWATGGAIRPDKTFWWLIDFAWEPKGYWRFRRIAEMPAEISLIGPDGTRETIRRLEPDEAEKTLGIMMAPDGDERAQEKKLRSAATEWAEKIKTGFLLKRDLLPMIRTTIMKTLEYPMALTTLSKKAWEKILSPILQVGLPKGGICRNFPRVVIFGPTQLQGLGLPHPYALQVAHHVEACLRHGTNQTNTGQYLSAALEAHQLELGIPLGLFQNRFDEVGLLASDTWLKKVWQELSDLDIHLAYQGPDVGLCRKDDEFLMDAFITKGYTGDDLRWLNWCRMHLHAVTLSDLATADGHWITEASWNGIRDPTRPSKYIWPRTAKPTRPHWLLWRAAISLCFLEPGDRSRQLAQPLGSWTDANDYWRWFYSPSGDSVFRRDTAVWTRAERQSHSRRAKYTISRTQAFYTDPLPTDLQ